MKIPTLPYCWSCNEYHCGICPPHECRTTGIAAYKRYKYELAKKEKKESDI